MSHRKGHSSTSASSDIAKGPEPRVRPSGRVLRGARQQSADLGDDLVLVRELAGCLLRVDIPTVEPDLEDAAGRGDEAHAREAVLVVVRDLFRQTDGFVQVPSSGAVFDLEVHDALLCCPARHTMRPHATARRSGVC